MRVTAEQAEQPSAGSPSIGRTSPRQQVRSESRLGGKVKGSHALTFWLVEHSADLLSKYSDRADGRVPYERWKGKPVKQVTAEFGEKVHYHINLKHRVGGEKLEARWNQGYFRWGIWIAGKSKHRGRRGKQ